MECPLTSSWAGTSAGAGERALRLARATERERVLEPFSVGDYRKKA
jgi:hypothetical protein